ncbi:hypothetical protein BH11BAC1_BH11BAC1_23230 [soil metagenome]
MKTNFTLLISILVFQLQAQPCIPNTNSVMFDGFSSYITVSPQVGLDISSAITIEAWIYPTSFGFTSAQNSIVCKHGWSSGEAGYVLRTGGTGELSFNIGAIDTNGLNVSWREVISTTGIMSLNTWYHVAATYDGFELKCYVNGNLEGTTAFTGSIAPSPAYPLAIGRLADPVWGPDRYFQGSIDEVRVWNRALMQNEILAGMNNHIDPAGASGLVSYWRMNEGVNSTLYDVAGTNNGGTVFCTWDLAVPFNAVPEVPVISYNGGTLYSSAPIGNQWYLGGTMLAGETQPSYTPIQNGVYSVEVTSPQGCAVMSVQFTVIDVSVTEFLSNAEVSIYPNPVHDKAIIKITASPSSENISFVISDLQGRSLDEINTVAVSSGQTTISFDRKDLCNGIYFFELKSADRILSKGKLLVE